MDKFLRVLLYYAIVLGLGVAFMYLCLAAILVRQGLTRLLG